MTPVDLGGFWATLPEGWTIGNDDGLTAVYPPDGDEYVQISTYRGPGGHEPTADELWEFASESIDEAWPVAAASVRQDENGYSLDAEGPVKAEGLDGDAVLAFRLWPGRLVFATFIYPSTALLYVGAVRAFMASLRPSREVAER